MDPSAAFRSFPTQERGILLASTYKPLSLHAADVQVRLSGSAAQVILSLEYVNETNKLVRAIAAYPAPPSYQLQCATLQGPAREISARSYVQSRPLRSVEAGSALRAEPLVDTAVSTVATQSVPWDVSPGESVLMKAVYHVPISATHRTGEIVFTLPTSLIPAAQRPPDVQRGYMKFLDARSQLRHLAQQGGSLRVCVDAQLLVPLRGVVTLEKGPEVVPEMGVTGTSVNVHYVGDARFQLTYHDDLPKTAYMQVPLCVRAPVAETSEPLRLHTVAASPPPTSSPSGHSTAEVAAAMVVSVAPFLANCPINAEIMFVVDVHSAALGARAAESVMAAIASLNGTASLVNVILCRDAHRGGALSLLPDGSVQSSAVPHESMLAFMKEEGVQTIPAGYVRNVIVLSDGGSQPVDADAVAMVCQVTNAGRACRVHAVALAATADHAVLEALAEACGGYFASAAASGSSEAGERAVDEAVQAAVSAAAVPCLVDIRTKWDVTGGDIVAASSVQTAAAAPSPLRMAADADGGNIACIPHGTQRLLYGLLASANSQLAVRLFGRVGEMRLEAPPMLMTAAAAARIAYLTHILHTTSEDEALEVIALSKRYMLPSPYTTLTDGNSGPGGEHKIGGVVHLPSMQAAAHVELAIRARRVELQAAAALRALHPA
ncbi:von Willebrand factor type A domain family protein [Leishmania donovani]|uniref:von Willebrand factor type A domain family protein n=1 Tax=Leishmania donovani TaxID=5661 RepID=A0A504Y033_LEIDO|nr:von Willebrand factor type A domain family protein [Leishmania donovani]